MKTNRTFVLAVLLLAAAALNGCSSDNNPASPGTPANSISVQDGSLELTIATDKASYDFGDNVVVTASLRNTGSAPVDLDFARGNPARYSNINVNIKDGGGLAHFVDGDGTVDKTTLGAGKALSYSWVWGQVSRLTRKPVDRGVYEVVGVAGFDDRDSLRGAGLFIELK